MSYVSVTLGKDCRVDVMGQPLDRYVVIWGVGYTVHFDGSSAENAQQARALAAQLIAAANEIDPIRVLCAASPDLKGRP